MKVAINPVANAGVSFAGVTERAAAAKRQAVPRCVPRLMAYRMYRCVTSYIRVLLYHGIMHHVEFGNLR